MSSKMTMSEAGRLGALKSKEVCQAKYLKRIQDYLLAPNKCALCLTPLAYEQRHNKYCGHSCSACVTNKVAKRKALTNKCKYCTATIHYKKVYCGRQCQARLRQANRIKQAEETGVLPSPVFRKKYLFSKFGNQCSICSTTEWCGKPVPLIMDHINGNPEDNSISNFRLVCGNCDMQLPTYKSKNKGKGRHYRRVRYSLGKSY